MFELEMTLEDLIILLEQVVDEIYEVTSSKLKDELRGVMIINSEIRDVILFNSCGVIMGRFDLRDEGHKRLLDNYSTEKWW